MRPATPSSKKFKIPLPLLALIPVFLGIIIYASINIVNWLIANARNSEIKTELESAVSTPDGDSYAIDFDKLKNLNPEAVAYLVVPGTNINYVVVQGGDNDYYLTHNFNHEYNVSGWIFADYRNQPPATTPNQNYIIYGHSTSDGSMFGSLPDTLNSSWQSNFASAPITLVTPSGSTKYQVFSTYTTEPEEYYLTTSFSKPEDFTTFLDTLKSRSNYQYPESSSDTSAILTLSTCNLDGSKRIVLHAKKLQSQSS